MKHASIGERLFNILNIIFLTAIAATCIAPMIHVFALSLSSRTAAGANLVGLWPVDFTLKSYEFILSKSDFQDAFLISLERLLLGLLINMLLTIIIAYPLSKSVKQFRWRTPFVWFFVISILFSGGLIPTFMTVKTTGLIDSILALVIPGAVPVFNVVLLLNFFRELPKELEESALMDGANHWVILWKIFVPLSLPALATITLFVAVNHWNSWFDGLIYMNSPERYPLQSYLQTIIIQNTNILGSFNSAADMKIIQEISNRTTKAAQIFIGALPVVAVYPFLQRYFVKGIVLGSVKQ